MSRHDLQSRCTPRDLWPAQDRELWLIACLPADPLEPEMGYAQRWKPTTRKEIERGYGRWLGWLERSGKLDLTCEPGDRASQEQVREYLDMLRDAGQADNTCAGRLQQLGNALRAMHQDRDWGWLHRASSRIYSKAVLVRDPVERMQPAADVIALGRDLMHAAVHDRFRTPLDRATLYRDGLMIALLVQRPFRLANFTAMALGRHVRHQGEAWRIHFEGAETKGGEIIDGPWPEALVENLEDYLLTHRKELLRTARSADSVHALWISRQGKPMGSDAIEFQIKGRTEEEFGRSINPHAFRHIAATEIATNNPDGALDIKSVLSHSSIATSEKHYNRATTLGASATYQQTLSELRRSQGT